MVSFAAGLCLALAAAIPADATPSPSVLHKGDSAKYVFFFIGDGMGLPRKRPPRPFPGNG
jgi:alkaline phosphatase